MKTTYYIIDEDYNKIAVFFEANLAYHYAQWYSKKNREKIYIVTKGREHNIILEINHQKYAQ